MLSTVRTVKKICQHCLDITSTSQAASRKKNFFSSLHPKKQQQSSPQPSERAPLCPDCIPAHRFASRQWLPSCSTGNEIRLPREDLESDSAMKIASEGLGDGKLDSLGDLAVTRRVFPLNLHRLPPPTSSSNGKLSSHSPSIPNTYPIYMMINNFSSFSSRIDHEEILGCAQTHLLLASIICLIQIIHNDLFGWTRRVSRRHMANMRDPADFFFAILLCFH